MSSAEPSAITIRISPSGAKYSDIVANERPIGVVSLKSTVRIGPSIGTLGGTLEADAGLISQIARASAAVTQKLGVLLRMAAGETAPLGPAADRARAEALRMLRASEVKDALSVEPEASAALNALMPAAGIRL